MTPEIRLELGAVDAGSGPPGSRGWLVLCRGQELDVVRRDPPDGLLVALAAGVAGAADLWRVDAREALPRAALDPLAQSLFDLLRTMASPPHGWAQR